MEKVVKWSVTELNNTKKTDWIIHEKYFSDSASEALFI